MIGMINRRRAAQGGSPALPYDYEVEYIESSGTQYINTGIYPDSSFTFECKVAVTIDNYNCAYWGCRSAGTYLTDDNQCFLNSDTKTSNTNQYSKKIFLATKSATSMSNWNSNITPIVNTMYNLTNITVSPTLSKQTYPITLFALNIIGNISTAGSKCRIGAWVAISNSVKVADFIPVVKDGVGYMYDKVSKQLFGNSGTGNFIIGPRRL